MEDQLIRYIRNSQIPSDFDKVNMNMSLKIIANNNIDFGFVDSDGNTALLWACLVKSSEIALALIATGKSNPGFAHQSTYYTALTLAVDYKMEAVSLALIATGMSNPGHINNAVNETALTYACMRKLSDVALTLINTNSANPKHVNDDDNTAFSIACNNNMKDVAFALVMTNAATINDLLDRHPEWSPIEMFCLNKVDVTEIDI